MLADKPYDAIVLIDCIESKNVKIVILPKKNQIEKWEYDRFQYRNRNVIEHFFAKINQVWRIVTSYGKLDSRFVSFATLATAKV